MRFVLSLLIIISACSPSIDNASIDITKLVLPDNQKRTYAIQCNLLPQQTLRQIEGLIPSFINEVKKANAFESVYIYFDQLQIEKFFFEFITQTRDKFEPVELLQFDLTSQYCEKDIEFSSVYLLIEEFVQEINTPYLVERSFCQFQQEKSYVDLMLGVDKLLAEKMLEDIRINSRVKQISGTSAFEWTNWYPNKTDIQAFKNMWMEKGLAKEIQKDFKETATCFGAQRYQAYKLL